MTKLCEMIMECRAIKGMDRLVLYGWASQLEEGNDTLYCSKETVAEAIGVSDDTVLRRTQNLVEAGWLIDTGEQKQCKFGQTPVRTINVPVIVRLVEAQCRKLRRVADRTPPQNAAQGSRFTGLSGFRSSGLSGSPSFFPSCDSATPTTTGVPPVVREAKRKEEVQTENLEPKTSSTNPNSVRLCPKCQEPWSRYQNHVCTPIPNKPLDSPLMDMEDNGQPLFLIGQEPKVRKAEEARQGGERPEQKTVEHTAWGRETKTSRGNPNPCSTSVPPKPCGCKDFDECSMCAPSTPNAHSPVPPTSDRCACGNLLDFDDDESCYDCARKSREVVSRGY